jgi:hypothetical protein
VDQPIPNVVQLTLSDGKKVKLHLILVRKDERDALMAVLQPRLSSSQGVAG